MITGANAHGMKAAMDSFDNLVRKLLMSVEKKAENYLALYSDRATLRSDAGQFWVGCMSRNHVNINLSYPTIECPTLFWDFLKSVLKISTKSS